MFCKKNIGFRIRKSLVFIVLIRDINTVDMDTKIKDCQTIAEVNGLGEFEYVE